jgi:uncharacterized OB-fold protein
LTVVSLQPIFDLAEPVRVVADAGGAVLVGMRCGVCQTCAFPQRAFCCNCGSSNVAVARLANRGELYSFSTVHISSTRETPYVIGYVDLDDGVRVMGLILTPVEPEIGQRMAVMAGDGDWWFDGVQDGE